MNSVLIIDDDKELCTLMKKCVEQENLSAVVAHGGLEGLRLLEENKDTCSLIILDVMMPGMDGFETLKKIRQKSKVPVLMFTSKNDNYSKVRGLREGADDYLTKPFHMDELLARIFSLIRRYTRFNRDRNSQEILQYEGLCVNIDERSVKTGNGTFELPPKEFDVLMFLAENQ